MIEQLTKYLHGPAVQQRKDGDKETMKAGNLFLNRLSLRTILWCGAFFFEVEVQAETPNVLFILVDDLGYMDVGCYNPNTFYDTPNIDKLAASGMKFSNGYAANPVCSPTRYSIQTGKYPTRVGATNYFSGKLSGLFNPATLHDRMDLEEITLAEALKTRGYATFFAGKWHLGPTVEFWPENQGYDINKGGWKHGAPWFGKKYFSPYGNPRLTDGPQGEHLPDRLATETNAFISASKKANKPFLAFLSFYSVHVPLIGRPDLVAKYTKRATQVTGSEFGVEELVWPKNKGARKVRILQKHAVYAAMVEAMDQAVGKVLNQLEALRIADNTIVCFTSDNGGTSTSEGLPTSNLPLRGGKGWLYEGGIRENFIVRWPGVTQAGSVCEYPVMSIDFLPTLCAAANVELKHQMDGKNLRPLLSGEKKTLDRDDLYWHYPHYSVQGGFPGGAIRSGKWKLIERYEDGSVQLYNLDDDIGERKNLADSNSTRVVLMRKRLHQWYKQVDARFLQPKGKNRPKPWRP